MVPPVFPRWGTVWAKDVELTVTGMFAEMVGVPAGEDTLRNINVPKVALSDPIK